MNRTDWAFHSVPECTRSGDRGSLLAFGSLVGNRELTVRERRSLFPKDAQKGNLPKNVEGN